MRVLGVQMLLLFFLSSGTAQITDPSMAAIWNELSALRNSVVEQSVELRHLTTRMEDAETKAEEERGKVLLLTSGLEDMRKKVEKQRVVLAMSQQKVTELEKENAVLSTEVSCFGNRVTANEEGLDLQSKDVASLRGLIDATETEVKQQKIKVHNLENTTTEQETRLNSMDLRITNNENQAEEQSEEVMSLRTELNSIRTEVQLQNQVLEQLQNDTTNKTAFSASLTDPIGTTNTEIVVKYSKIISNIGNAYSSTTGKFTAPVRGVYYFRYTAYHYQVATRFGAFLYHNDQLITADGKYIHGNDDHKYLSNGAILQLEVGDEVYVNLPRHNNLYGNHNTFSGFFLFRV